MFNFLKNSHVLYNLKLVGKRNCVIIDYESGVSPTSRGKKKKKNGIAKKEFSVHTTGLLWRNNTM